MRQPEPAQRALKSAILAAILACGACGGKGERATGAPDSGADGTPVPAGQAASECVEVARSTLVETTTRKTWNAAERTLTATATSSADAGAAVSTLKWRYRTDGQIVAYIGVEQPFQHDYEYDAEGNRTDFHLSYPAVPDLMTPSSAEPWSGAAYENEYAEGRLVASTLSEYGASQPGVPPILSSFTEDAEGRCVEIDDSEFGKRVISYDAAGRVAEVVQTGAFMRFCADATTTTTYDDAGRIIETNMDCSGGNRGLNNSGVRSTQHTYHADGSETVDYVDGLVDVGDGRLTTTRTAACLEQDAAIGKPLDLRCRVGMPL